MRYGQNSLLNKKLPSFVGFFVLLIALVITVMLSRNSLTFVSKATAGSVPKNIQLSNVTSTSFTVSYTTDAPAVGTVSYGKDLTTDSVALDDRDQQTAKPADHTVHFVTVKNLTPGTKYYYVIDSGSQKTDSNGTPFSVMTEGASNTMTGNPTLSGSVGLNDGTTPTEGIVYVTAAHYQQLATLISPDGSYSVDLNQMQSSAASSEASLAPDTVLNLQAMTSTTQSTVTTLVSQATNVPKIVLSQNYDFTLGTEQSSTSAQTASSSGSFPEVSSAPVSSPIISTPQETQAFKDQKPLFQGKALANTEVDITIQSQQEISVKVQSDNNGSWQFRPNVPLAPGKHTITIQSVDASGILQTISRSFTVYAEGSQFTEPSVSPPKTTPSPIPTFAPTPTAIVQPTAKPTPTAVPTIVPTSTPKLTIVPSKGPLPKTGSSAEVTGMIATISILGIGALLFFLSVV